MGHVPPGVNKGRQKKGGKKGKKKEEKKERKKKKEKKRKEKKRKEKKGKEKDNKGGGRRGGEGKGRKRRQITSLLRGRGKVAKLAMWRPRDESKEDAPTPWERLRTHIIFC